MKLFATTTIIEFPSGRRETHVIESEARNRTQASKHAKDHVYTALRDQAFRIVSCVSRPVEPRNAYRVPFVSMTFEGSDNRDWKIQSMFIDSDGVHRTVIETDGPTFRTVTDGQLHQLMQPVEKVEYWTVYPHGNVYSQTRPIKTSSYDMDELVRIKVTKRNGKIVRKEFL